MDEPDYAEIGRRGAALARAVLANHELRRSRDLPYLPPDLAAETQTQSDNQPEQETTNA